MARHGRRRIWGALAFVAVVLAAFIVLAAPAPALAAGTSTMYRLYNPNSGEHFYTANSSERDNVVRAGWNYEGIGWTAPAKSNTPVYRLYSGTDHHYTMSAAEKDWLVSVGWKYEGIGWYSDDAKGVPLYRQFNPNVQPSAPRNNSGSHNYTTSKAENDHLVSVGWRAEGIGWYGVDTAKKPNSPTNPTEPSKPSQPTEPSKPDEPTNPTGPAKRTYTTEDGGITVTYAEGVKPVTGTVSEDRKSATLPAGTKVAVGDLVTVNPDDPDGADFRVTSVTETAEGVVITGTKPKASEVLERLVIDETLDTGNSVFVPSEYVEMSSDEAPAARVYDTSGGEVDLGSKEFTITSADLAKSVKDQGGSVDASLKGYVKFKIHPKVQLHGDINPNGQSWLDMGFEPDASIDAKVEGSVNAEIKTPIYLGKYIKVAGKKTGVEAGLYLVPSFAGKVEAVLGLSGKAEAKWSSDAGLSGGLSAQPTWTGTKELSAGMALRAKASAYWHGSEAGANADAGVVAKYTETVHSDANASMTCYDRKAWVDVRAAVKVDALDIDKNVVLADESIAYRWDSGASRWAKGNPWYLYKKHSERTGASGDAVEVSECTWNKKADGSESDFADDAGEWNVWNSVKWRIANDTLYIRPADSPYGEGTLSRYDATQRRREEVPWASSAEVESVTKVKSSGTIHVDSAASGALFTGFCKLRDISDLAGWSLISSGEKQSVVASTSGDRFRISDVSSEEGGDSETLTESRASHIFYASSGTWDGLGLNCMFYRCSSLTDLSPLSGWDTSAVTYMGGMFSSCAGLTSLSPLSGWDTSSVTGMSEMFEGCAGLTDLSPLSGWETSAVTNMYRMFSGCAGLASLSPLSGWDTSAVRNMYKMFSDCASLADLSGLGGWNTSQVTSMDDMFSGCAGLNSLSPLSGWDTSNVTGMCLMFSGCAGLTDLSPLSGWDTSNVTSMDNMFSGCAGLTSLSPLSGWDTSQVSDMDGMFSGCTGLADATALAGWDTSHVTNMSGVFRGCSSLVDISGIRDWVTSAVAYMDDMFSGCAGLTDLSPLSGWDTSHAIWMGGMFEGCAGLTSLSPLSSWDTSQVSNMKGMFSGCTGLADATALESWNVSRVPNPTGVFDVSLPNEARPTWAKIYVAMA